MPNEDEHRFQLRLPKAMFLKLTDLADRENRTVNGQMLSILERALGPALASTSAGTPLFLQQMFERKDSIALRSFVRNISQESKEHLLAVVERLLLRESGQITRNEILPRASAFIEQALPTTASIEEFALAAIEYDSVDGVRLGLRMATELNDLGETLHGGSRFAQGLPGYLSLRLLLVMGAKAVADRKSELLSLVVNEPLEMKEPGGGVTITPLWERRQLFFPEALLGYADLAAKQMDAAWSSAPHLPLFFDDESAFRENLVSFLLVLALRSALEMSEQFYPGYRLITGGSGYVSAFAARASRDARFRRHLAEGVGESEDEFVRKWENRVEKINAAGLGADYFDTARKLPTTLS